MTASYRALAATVKCARGPERMRFGSCDVIQAVTRKSCKGVVERSCKGVVGKSCRGVVMRSCQGVTGDPADGECEGVHTIQVEGTKVVGSIIMRSFIVISGRPENND